MSAREYRLVLGEVTTALFACPDCGAVVWYSLREKHDQLHEQIEALIATTWRQSELLDTDESRLDDHAGQIAHLQSQVDSLDSSVYRLDDTVRDIGYRADEAQRAAERAADTSSRGW